MNPRRHRPGDAAETEEPFSTAGLPESNRRFALKWDGEWHITYEVFRDLGIAFGVGLFFHWRHMGCSRSHQPDRPGGSAHEAQHLKVGQEFP